MINLNALAVHRIPLIHIDREFRLTDFSLTSQNNSLEYSIRELGVSDPLLLVQQSEGYGIISGHQRFRWAESLHLPDIPARIIADMETSAMMETNLIANTHKHYSDVEKGLILQKFLTAGVPESRIIDRILPVLGLEKSKKLYLDLLRAGKLPPGLRLLMHELKSPLRYFSACFRWDSASLGALESLLSLLRPGTNKLRDLLDLLDETACREQTTVAELLSRPELRSVLECENRSSHETYDRVFQVVYQWRYPLLADMKRKVLLALDKLKLDDRIKIRAAENFENGEIKVEFKFTSQAEFKKLAEQLSGIADSEALGDLTRIVRDHR